MSTWDGFWGDMDRAILAEDFRKAAEIYQQRIANLNDAAIEAQDTAASLYGHREALIAQLQRYDINNPLIKDDSLIDRIKKAAISTFRLSKPIDYDNAKNVGRTFRIPGHEGPVHSVVAPAPAPAPASSLPTTLSTVHNHPAHIELQQQYAGSLALRAALSEVVKQLDPDHPLLKDLYLQSNIRKAGITAFTLGNLDYDAARSAGVSFVLPKRADGDVEQPGT